MDDITKLLHDEINRQFKNNVKSFAEKSGVPYSTVRSALQKGIGGTSIDNIFKICKTLNITADGLSRGVIEPIPLTQIKTIVSFAENDLIKKYRSLSERDKETVSDLIDSLSKTRTANKQDNLA